MGTYNPAKTCIEPFMVPLSGVSHRMVSQHQSPEDALAPPPEATKNLHEVLNQYDYQTQVYPLIGLLHPVLGDIIDMTHIGKLDVDIGFILDLSESLVSYLRGRAVAQLRFMLHRPPLTHGDLDKLVKPLLAETLLSVLHAMWDDPSQSRCGKALSKDQPWVSYKFKQLLWELQALIDTGHSELQPILAHFQYIKSEKLFDVMSYHAGHPSKGRKRLKK